MAQSTAPPRAVTLRNFSRRPRVPNVPPAQRLHGIDAAWIAGFAAISVLMTFLAGGAFVFGEPQTYLSAVTVAVIYLLGFRVRDRSTAVIAAALLAGSPLFAATQIQSVGDCLFVLLTISALAASAAAPYTATAELLSVIIAAAATIIRPEGFLLGAVLVGFAIADKRPGGIVGLLIYLVVTFAGIAGLALYTHHRVPTATFSLNVAPFLSLIDTQTVILSCFVIALLGDLADSARRGRWNTVIVWAVLFLCVESLFRFSGFSFASGPFRPILFLLAAGGIARLLPVLAGDFPNPTLRYGVATLFVGLLVAARVFAEWPQAKRLLAINAGTASLDRRVGERLNSTAPAASHIGSTAVAPSASRQPAKSTSAAKLPSHPPAKALPSKPVKLAKLSPPDVRLTAPFKSMSGNITVPPGTVHHYVIVPPGAFTLKPAAPHAAARPKISLPAKPTTPVLARTAKPVSKVANLPVVPGVPASIVAQAKADGVPTYWMRRGHLVPRTLWAIQWDIAHKPKPVAKPAVAVRKTPAIPLKPVAKVAPKAAARVAAKPVIKVAAPKPAIKAARPQVAQIKPPKPVVKLATKPALKITPKAVTTHKPAAPANSLAARAAAAGVPMYHTVNGRLVPRNMWAIQWDIAHKPAHPAVSTPRPKPSIRSIPPHIVTKAAIAARPVSKPHPRMAAIRQKPRAIPAHTIRPVAHRPVRRAPLRKRHRSIWAIRWQQANSKHR